MSFFKNPLFLAILGGIAVGSAIALNLLVWSDDPIEPRPLPTVEAIQPAPTDGAETDSATAVPQQMQPVEAAGDSDEAQPGVSDVILPSFDVVRVTPDGNAVIAGRAAPGQLVEILDGERVLGTVKADDRGEWVFVPTDPLLPGNRQLSLRIADGGNGPIESDQIVMVVVPERDSSGDAFAVATSKQGDQASVVLQKPGSSSLAILSIDAIDYDDAGTFRLSGRAAPNALVNIYLDEAYLGTAQADEDGHWSLTPEIRVNVGQYELRADQVDDKGTVHERITMPFMRDDKVPEMEPGSFYVVQPGNSLWRIARRVYGKGLSFTVIYKANKDQIGDPDLIYPGQVFSLPQ